MSLTGGIIIFVVSWFLSLYVLLPLGFKSQEEAGHVEPGTPASAPAESQVKRKMIWATIWAAIIWVAVYAFLKSHIVTVADLEAVFSRPK